ncbi:hypothetical protein TrLO_g6870 [Triparma laevis f. longispina]|uniref:Uncharacterized protein n=1 Tax=Triparma laevis f. longispina TaxID=1714387 RepID=A0A9W7EL44_9STRA|nr:hypothetical protein TrLO_g6870 [Triparma laevis f. longispina]
MFRIPNRYFLGTWLSCQFPSKLLTILTTLGSLAFHTPSFGRFLWKADSKSFSVSWSTGAVAQGVMGINSCQPFCVLVTLEREQIEGTNGYEDALSCTKTTLVNLGTMYVSGTNNGKVETFKLQRFSPWG